MYTQKGASPTRRRAAQAGTGTRSNVQTGRHVQHAHAWHHEHPPNRRQGPDAMYTAAARAAAQRARVCSTWACVHASWAMHGAALTHRLPEAATTRTAAATRLRLAAPSCQPLEHWDTTAAATGQPAGTAWQASWRSQHTLCAHAQPAAAYVAGGTAHCVARSRSSP